MTLLKIVLILVLLLILVTARKYVNYGRKRVQLFKSTSKFGDNHHCSHRERGTMTLGLAPRLELNMYDPRADFECLHS